MKVVVQIWRGLLSGGKVVCHCYAAVICRSFKKSVHLRCVLRCEDCFGFEAEAKIFLVMEKELVSTFCVFIVQSQCNTTIRSKFPQLKASRE